MKAEERTIAQILTNQVRYEIPPYQRPYSWEEENVRQLLEDLLEAYEAKDREYFIGSLITIEREHDRFYRNGRVREPLSKPLSFKHGDVETGSREAGKPQSQSYAARVSIRVC